MWTRLKWWIVCRLGGEVKSIVTVPTYRPVTKMSPEDYVSFITLFDTNKPLFKYLHILADNYEYSLASTPFDEKHDRDRIAAQAKLWVVKDLLLLPKTAATKVEMLKSQMEKDNKILNNLGESEEKGNK